MSPIVLTADHIITVRLRAALKQQRVPYEQIQPVSGLTAIQVQPIHRRLAMELLENIYESQPWRRLSIPRRYLLVRENRGLLTDVAKQSECSPQAVGQVWRGITASRRIESALSRAYLSIAPLPEASRSH